MTFRCLNAVTAFFRPSSSSEPRSNSNLDREHALNNQKEFSIMQKTSQVAETTLKESIASRLSHSFGLHKLANVANSITGRYKAYQGFGRVENAITKENNLETLSSLGGVQKNLNTTFSSIDSMHLSVEAFTKRMSAAGGQYFDIETNGDEKAISGLVFSEENGKKFLHAMEQAGMYGDASTDWKSISHNGQLFIVPSSSKNSLEKQLKYFSNNLNITYRNVASQSTQSTVILCQGIRGRYAGNVAMQEAGNFLLQGMNVMLFDYRGTGDSKGFISENGIDQDLEKIYTFLKQEKKIPDEKMLIKGECFGAGPATRFARTHKGVNLFISQAPSNLQVLAHEQIEKDAGTDQKTWWTAAKRFLFDRVGFSYNIAEDLKQVQGHVAMAVNHSDEEVDNTHDDLNRKSLRENSNLNDRVVQEIALYGIEHGERFNKIGNQERCFSAEKCIARTMLNTTKAQREQLENRFANAQTTHFLEKANLKQEKDLFTDRQDVSITKRKPEAFIDYLAPVKAKQIDKLAESFELMQISQIPNPLSISSPAA
ncbi:MAG: hypothetical protein K0S74_344 [Chlamydiales bacterium]|jgi:dienelactone hydrolase|nr:hypothetical protein [Chlamydiales bacterium]